MAKAHKEPVVTKVVSSSEVMRVSMPPNSHIEMRQKQNGTWTVWYPDPGWIPCAPVCRLATVQPGHKHDYQQGWIQTNYTPTSYEDALEWADLLAEGHEVKILPHLTIAERNAAKRAFPTNTTKPVRVKR